MPSSNKNYHLIVKTLVGCGTSINSNRFIISKGLRQIHRTEIVPVRVKNLSGHEKVICKNSEIGQCAPVEAVINNEQSPELAQLSAKDHKEFGENVEKWVEGLAAPERNKAKKLLALLPQIIKDKVEQAWSHMKLILAKQDR